MKIAVVFALLAISTFAFIRQDHNSLNGGEFSLAEISKVNSLKETSMGRLLLGMAEVHFKSDAPIQRLIQGLQDFEKELQEGINSENEAYASKKAAHEATIQSLNARVGEAKGEVALRQSRINSVLNPRIEQAQSDIGRDSSTKGQKEEDLVNAEKARTLAHYDYTQRVNEHNEFIAAVDEALPLLNGLRNQAPSLLQVRKVSMTLKNIHNKLSKSSHTEVALLEALINLATSQNFANQEILDKVIGEFNKLRKKLSDSLALENANEAAAQSEYEAFVAQTKREIGELASNIQKNTITISNTQREVTDNEHVISDKTFEISDLNDTINAENENFRRETDIHHQIIDEFNKEVDVVKQCQALFQNAHFSEYVLGRLGN
eukprot:TRINITY_DN825_c0_g1_i1.p1 TRINITY_DN825_c0_g1~~TRINITY_DN825_c0_g1_i1.p1  ORF type:complete len:377 (-),score=137.54 TRINITY_DN825_c0_g1_i1:190-1320(-)